MLSPSWFQLMFSWVASPVCAYGFFDTRNSKRNPCDLVVAWMKKYPEHITKSSVQALLSSSEMDNLPQTTVLISVQEIDVFLNK